MEMPGIYNSNIGSQYAFSYIGNHSSNHQTWKLFIQSSYMETIHSTIVHGNHLFNQQTWKPSFMHPTLEIEIEIER